VRAAYETYHELGSDYFTNRDPERQTKRLEPLAHHVTLTERSSLRERTFHARQIRLRRPRRPLSRQGRTVTHAAPPATATPWGLWPTENVSMT
jgi:hypothetical protein